MARLLSALSVLSLFATACASGPSTPTPSALRPTATPPPATSTPALTPTATAPPAIVDRIAYVGEDGSIHVLAKAWEEDTILAKGDPSRFTWYTWPSWDPSGSWIAFSRYVQQDTSDEISLLAEKTDGTQTRTLDTRSVGSRDPLVVTGAPHYIQWAPTGKSIAFLAPTSGILTLNLVDNSDGSKAEEITRGPSINFTWGRTGAFLYLHNGEDLAVVDTALPLRPAPLGPQSSVESVPAQSPRSNDIAFANGSPQGDALFVGDAGAINAGTARPVYPLNGQAAFLWSPLKERLVITTSDSPDSYDYSGLSILDPAGGGPLPLVTEKVIAFFWSPDGAKIAYVTRAEERGSVQLKVIPAGGGEAQTVATFSPTQDMAVYLSFFDQFAYSHSMWSPDSRRLVIAQLDASGASSIQVLDAQGVEAPRTVAQGTLAFWSPR